ncbi:uncharacterized protein Dwil_GK10944 [Drosophila willistoni]|uniref:Natalisin n=1 Tax=Drosophila willistoni TaxID=7260 RepID=B4N938_DROWI|nr:uncharacterized protein LOC6647030 [Drosophila willistoni]EDW81585.2 uncharacterized protein Dwil_GK10944 [Drosophila willistoni]
MRLTLAWLCVCLAIYCGGHGNVVLSLPPSLIATATEAAALRQQQQHRWKKDARVLLDSGNDALRDMLHSKASSSSSSAANAANGKFTGQDAEVEVMDVEQQPQLADFNRKALNEAYDLEGQQQGLARREQQSMPQEIAVPQRSATNVAGLKYATPHKYWESRCQGGLKGSANCPREYYRAMLAARNKDALMQMNSMQDSYTGSDDASDDVSMEADESEDEDESSNDVFMLLTGEQDLIKFLNWAMQRLYPYERFGGNLSESAAEFYHPGMFLWKKLNLSGHLEPPLIVDEPHYVLVRREKLLDGYQMGDDVLHEEDDDPFIPPRGRKHNSPDLDALMNRYETFMPNRGKRDKVKDLFKYDDLFFPNRGKKHRNIFQVDDPFFPNRGKKLQLRDLYNVDDPFFPNRGKRHMTRPAAAAAAGLWAKLLPKRKLQTGRDNNNNNNYNNWPQRMSTHKINSYDQSVKSSLSAMDAAASAEGPHWQRLPANRLHSSTRSMSEHPQQEQQQQQEQRVRFIANPTMRQQVKSTWPFQRFQRSRETQLTRSLNANLVHDTDIGTDSNIDTDYGNLVI